MLRVYWESIGNAVRVKSVTGQGTRLDLTMKRWHMKPRHYVIAAVISFLVAAVNFSGLVLRDNSATSWPNCISPTAFRP